MCQQSICAKRESTSKVTNYIKCQNDPWKTSDHSLPLHTPPPPPPILLRSLTVSMTLTLDKTLNESHKLYDSMTLTAIEIAGAPQRSKKYFQATGTYKTCLITQFYSFIFSFLFSFFLLKKGNRIVNEFVKKNWK